VGERHLQGVERQVDVGAVLVAARGEVPLDQADRVLGEMAAVLAGPRPVGIGDLGDDFATLFQRFENDADVEVLAKGGADTDFDVVEVDEDRDVDSFLMGQNSSFLRLWLSVEAATRCEARSTRLTAAGVTSKLVRSRQAPGLLRGHAILPRLRAGN